MAASLSLPNAKTLHDPHHIVNKRETKNYANYTQILHLTLHFADLSFVTKCIVCVSNPAQTIHKTLHCNHKTLHGGGDERCFVQGLVRCCVGFSAALCRVWLSAQLSRVRCVVVQGSAQGLVRIFVEFSVAFLSVFADTPLKNPTILSHFSAIRH